MTSQPLRIAGMPYVAGRALGRVRHGLDGATAEHLVVLEPGTFDPARPLPAGFIVVDGAPFSHGMIPLLGAGVPTVIVSRAQAEALRDGLQLSLDGSTGLIGSGFAPASTAVPAADARPYTRDGVAVTLRVSARHAAAARRAVAGGAQAIGLVRSEFLLPDDGGIPNEDFCRQAFQTLCEAAAPLPVTIRLIDIAVDKCPAWLPPLHGASGTLGLQGVRLFSQTPVDRVYRAQVAAVGALSERFRLSLLLPYVSSSGELLEWVERTRRLLRRPVPVGAMAETPAAALELADWLDTVEFAGIGCNDLMQCLFGADRDQPRLRAYLDPYAPALYRFLDDVAQRARGKLRRIQLCGVLPQLPGVLPVLLGLGFRVFSVEAASLTWLRQTIAATSTVTARKLAQQVCAAPSSLAARSLFAQGAGLTP